MYESEFRGADEMSTGALIDPGMDGPVSCFEVATLRQELESLSQPKVHPGLLDFIGSLLIVGHTKRLIAAEALEHLYPRSTEI